VQEYSVRLPLDDASRLHALVALFPGRTAEEIVTDLLHAALDEIAASMPYEPGPKSHFAGRSRRSDVRGCRPHAAIRRIDAAIPQGSAGRA
jgi:hypothetical protein